MTTLVTGAAGFIGSNLCSTLLKQGKSVIGIDNFITSDGSNLKALNKFPRFTFLKHDIINPLPKQLSASRLRLDAIYHLACPTGVPNLTRLAEEMLLTCTVGTHNILELAKIKHAKFLFTSSSEVYGNPLVSPQKETYTGNVDPTGVRSPYEEGKRVSESWVMTYLRKYKLDAKIVRIFNTYGPGMNKSDTRVIPRFLSQTLKNQLLTLHGEGQQKRTFCYVDDLVAGLNLVMEKGKAAEVYNLGSDIQVTIKELAQLIIKATKSKSLIKTVARPRHDHESRLPDLTKINRLDWFQKINLTKGIELTLKTT